MAYGYKRTETVQSGQVTGTLTDFPALFSRTHNDFRTVGNGGHVQNANGYDLNLYEDSGGSVSFLVDMETELYVAATGQVIKWGRLYAAATGFVVWWQYGDSGITTSQDNVAGVWNSGYAGVYHFGDGTTLSLVDSTSHGNNGTNHSATATTGPIRGALATTSTQYATVPLDLSGTNKITVQCWFNKSSYANDDAMLCEFTSNSGPYAGFFLDPNGSGGTFELLLGRGNALNIQDATFTRPSTGTHAITATYDKTLGAVLGIVAYIDGSSVSLTDFAHQDMASAAFANDTLYLMCRNGASLFTDGWLAELRVSSSLRSADWIAADYNNQSAPTTFWGLGSETAVGSGQPTVKRMGGVQFNTGPFGSLQGMRGW